MSPRPTTANAIVLRATAARVAEESTDMLRGVAYNAGARGDQVEEAVQQGFAQLLSAFPGDPADTVGVRRYLIRCVQSSAWKAQRTERRRSVWMARDSERDRFEVRSGDNQRSDGVEPGEPLERMLDHEALHEARELLQELPEEWAAVLILSAAGYGTSEIAEQLGLTARQVRKRVQKANAQLKELRS